MGSLVSSSYLSKLKHKGGGGLNMAEDLQFIEDIFGCFKSFGL